MLNRSRKKSKGSREDYEQTTGTSKVQYSRAIQFVQSFLEHEEKEGQISLLEYVMDVIKEDIKYDLLSELIYQPEHFGEELPFPFPRKYEDDQGVIQRWADHSVSKQTIDLSETCTLVLPWNRKRLFSSLVNVRNFGFIPEPSNHRAYYFSHVGICYVQGGRHSTAAAIHQRKGTIEAEELDISQLFDHVDTDGAFWFSKHNKETLEPVYDFRISVIYELARMKAQL